MFHVLYLLLTFVLAQKAASIRKSVQWVELTHLWRHGDWFWSTWYAYDGVYESVC